MPGVSDVARAKDIIGQTAILEFKLVEAGPASKDDLLKQYNGNAARRAWRSSRAVRRAAPTRRPRATSSSKIAPVTGPDLRVAKPGLDENNMPAVHFELKSAGAQKFGKLSGDNLGRYLAIILDNKVVSAPKLEGRITDQGASAGGFTAESANDLSLTLRSGALPASLTYLQERGRRPVARRRLDPRRRHLVVRRPAADHGVHALLLQAVGHQRRSSRWSSTWSSCSG